MLLSISAAGWPRGAVPIWAAVATAAGLPVDAWVGLPRMSFADAVLSTWDLVREVAGRLEVLAAVFGSAGCTLGSVGLGRWAGAPLTLGAVAGRETRRAMAR